MKKRIGKIALLTALAAVLVVPVGCAEPEAVSNTTSPTVSNPAPQSNRWLELLKVLPSNGQAGPETTWRGAFLQDYAYLEEKKAQYPSAPEGEYSLLNRDPPSLFQGMKYNDEEWRATLGFVKADVDQTVYAYHQMPMDYYVAVRGEFTRTEIDNAVKTGPMNDVLEVVPYAGEEFYSWDTDREIKIDRRSNVRPLGRGMRLSLVNDVVFWTGLTQDMKDMIDTCKGNAESLADLENYQLLAGGLAKLDTFTAFFSSESQAQSHVTTVFKQIIDEPGEGEGARMRRTMAEQLQREVLLKPYEGLATGAGLDADGYYMAVVLLNADAETATYAASVIEEQITDSNTLDGTSWGDSIDSMEVSSQGRLTLAKIHGTMVHWGMFDIVSGMYEPLLMYKG